MHSQRSDQSARTNNDENGRHVNNTASSTGPSRARLVVVMWLCSMAAILYLDRICWGQAAPKIKEEFGLTNTQIAYLAMAFQLAYGLFEVPTGRWGELIGARRVLTRITIWWSIFTAATGACGSFLSLLIVRFLFGAGEAGAYPNAARVLTRWFPTGERGRVQGIMLAASLIGGALSPSVAASLIDGIGWRWTFAVFGSIGFVWAAGFWLWFRDTPDQHSWVNAEELASIRAGGGIAAPTVHEPVPWSIVVTNRGILILSAIITCSSFNSYFYFNWFPSYLTSAHGISNSMTGLLASLALSGAACGVFCGGLIADRIVRRGEAAMRIRRMFCSSTFFAGALSLYLAVQCESVVWLASFTAVSLFCTQLALPSWWSSAIEQSGKHVGPLFGLMNMMGTGGALISLWFVGVFADYQKSKGLSGREQWDPMFNVYVLILIAAGVFWLLYRKHPLRELEPQQS